MIKVNFEAYNNYITDSLYQWDINQSLNISGLNLTTAPEVHFANANMERAIVRPSVLNDGTVTVLIPNSLLQEALPIKAYVGIYEGDAFKVIESIKIPVIAKERPTDYSFVDDANEIYSYNEILLKMTEFEEKYSVLDIEALNTYSVWVEKVENTYTKDEVLTDETRSLVGLDSSAVPNDVLNILCEKTHRIVIKEYTGTGTWGANNPNILNFDTNIGFKPKLILIPAQNLMFIYGSNTAPTVYYNYSGGNAHCYPLSVTWSDNKVEWYFPGGYEAGATTDERRALVQANTSGQVYMYVAIG